MKELEIHYLEQIPYEINEAVNELRVNLSFAGKDKKAIMITSSIPNEGKSFLSLALWKSLAEVGKKVVFIDADLRMSLIRKIYDLKTDSQFLGLAHILSDQCDINAGIYSTNVPNGFMIPATTDIANPANLLESDKFKEIINLCKNVFDYIIIDTPPLSSVPDALTVGSYCDGSILVVRSGYTKKSAVKESVQKLQAQDKPFLGFALNRVDMSKHSGYYYYHYQYKYGNYYAPHPADNSKKSIL